MKRLIFISSFDYPSRYAHAIHGLYMARAFHKKLGDNFLFFANASVDDTLVGIPHRLTFGRHGRLVKKLHLRRALLPFSLRSFFAAYSTWQGSDTAVFINDPMMFEIGVMLKRRYGVKLVFEVHGSLHHEEQHALTEADRVIFLTTFLAKEACAHLPGLAVRTSVIPNAVEVSAFTRVQEGIAALRAELSLPDAFLVGYVGRFEPMGSDKGLHLMVDALAELPSNVQMVFVGGAKDEIHRYRAYAVRRNVAGRITFVPHVAPGLVPKYEKACDILAYVPSGESAFYEKETSPMKLYEYMASERPIIVSDLPTTREAVPLDSALYVSPGAIGELVEAVKAIMAAPGEAKKRVARAASTVRENTWERRVDRILEGLI